MTAFEWRGRSPASRRAKISIVTSTLNVVEALPHTMRSIRAELSDEIEWLVIDGASTDGTVELLRANEDCVTWKSEPDGGLYEAWNKACERASGEWLLFLGAGDELMPRAVEKIMPTLADAHPAHNLVYGCLQYLSPGRRQVIETAGEPWGQIASRWELMRPALPPHNAVFHHRSLFEAGWRFDQTLSIAADAEFMLRAIGVKPPLFAPHVVSRVPIGGVSFRLASALAIRRQIREINRRLGLRPPIAHAISDTLALAAKVAVSAFLPERLGFIAADTLRALQGKPRRWTIR